MTSGTRGGVKQIDGPVEATQFGNVQVRVILNDGRITDAQPLQAALSLVGK